MKCAIELLEEIPLDVDGTGVRMMKPGMRIEYVGAEEADPKTVFDVLVKQGRAKYVEPAPRLTQEEYEAIVGRE